jgi:hypothetical protein
MSTHERVTLRVGLYRVRGLGVALQTEAPRARRVGGKPIKLARMLAMAHVLWAQVQSGELRGWQEAAEHHQMSKARVSQLLDLTLIAPDIQAQILEMTKEAGEDPVHERDVRALIRDSQGDWEAQRAAWTALMRLKGIPHR